ncbi:MAG TPA: hypothetical protein VHN80_02840, partial [Kineosporiaceae bacterium]|nr:hypothetical protein [Kineosporiaceae bacterium]
VLLLGACSASGSGPSDDRVELRAGAQLFATRPAKADCARVDVGALRQMTGVDEPAPEPVLASQQGEKPSLTWAGCVGWEPAAAASGAAASGGDPGATDPATDPAADRRVMWIVSYATSAAASSDKVTENPLVGGQDVRTLIRSTTIGSARAQVQLSVHADDHETLVLVNVFDPATGRAGAQCGITAVPGGRADDVVQWCLNAITGQLVRKTARAAAATSPS